MEKKLLHKDMRDIVLVAEISGNDGSDGTALFNQYLPEITKLHRTTLNKLSKKELKKRFDKIMKYIETGYDRYKND